MIVKKLLPIKFHYFFFLGGMGGVVPYMPVIAKGLGINATAVGLIFTVLPFCVFISKPFFGYLTDYFQNIKVIILILVLVTSTFFMLVLLIPPIEKDAVEVHLKCFNSNTLSIFPFNYDRICLESVLKQTLKGELHYSDCESNNSKILIGDLNGIQLINPENVEGNYSGCEWNVGNSSFYLQFQTIESFPCDCITNGSLRTESSLASCFCEKVSPPSFVYHRYQFWIFALIAIISGMCSTTVYSLSDAACYEILGDCPELYGRQRLWGTLSWGLATSLAGVFNDLATEKSIDENYSSGFYLMLCLVFIDVLLLLKIQMKKANLSFNICKDITKIFSSWETVVFAIAVYIIGAFSGLLWSYEFWFLQDLGASQTLLGLTIAVQCLVAEVPMFFFSGWFIKTFGYIYCLTAVFAAFALRYGFYFILKNPWLVLPIEILHGFTFAIFYASMTGYASTNAPSGTEATMMGIFGGLYEGLGVATGSLLGGVGFDTLGGSYTFLVACFISVLCIPSLLISHLIIKYFSSKEKTYNITTSSNKKNDIPNPESKICSILDANT